MNHQLEQMQGKCVGFVVMGQKKNLKKAAGPNGTAVVVVTHPQSATVSRTRESVLNRKEKGKEKGAGLFESI